MLMEVALSYGEVDDFAAGDRADERAERELLCTFLRGPDPCQSCPLRERCRLGLACEQFRGFVNGLSEVRWKAAARQPTRAIFAAVFDEAADDRKPGRPPKAVDPVSAARASGDSGACGLADTAGDSGF
jgi:hypothetical protein